MAPGARPIWNPTVSPAVMAGRALSPDTLLPNLGGAVLVLAGAVLHWGVLKARGCLHSVLQRPRTLKLSVRPIHVLYPITLLTFVADSFALDVTAKPLGFHRFTHLLVS